MKRTPILVFLALTIHLSLHAQRIHGRIIDDSTNTGLEQASVMISGTTKGTTSGADGLFSILLPADGKKHSLVITHSGYTDVRVALTDTTSAIVIHLKRSVSSLDDVVVIGYQTVKRKDVMASISSVSNKDVKDIPINSAEEALAGRLAGVQVTASEGSPNAQIQIRVRGGGSITQNNAPLYVVDGVQLDNALQFLALQDIESIDVLKDAAATSIYGARGSNGVVIITTKGGHNTGGKTTITYNGYAGAGVLEKELPVQRPYDYMYYQYERAQQTGDTTGIAPYGGFNWQTVQNYKNTPFYDWQKKVLGRTAFMDNHNVNLSGGTEQTQYYLSVTDQDQQGVMLLSDFHRKLVYFRFDHQAAKNLKIGANVRFNNTLVDGAGTSNVGSSSLNFLRNVIRYRPFLAAGQTANSLDEAYTDETDANSLSLVNPVLLNQAQYRKNNQNIVDLSAFADYRFTPWLSFRSTFGYDYNNLGANLFDDTLTNDSKINGAGLPIASITTTVATVIDNSNVLTYSNAAGTGRFHEHNTLTVIAGEELYRTDSNVNLIQTDYFPAGTTAQEALANMNLGTPPNASTPEPKPNTRVVPTRMLSFFSRATYSYDNKYLFAASIRADGSSAFAPGNQWGYFPAGSAAWRISNENFMSGVSWITDLKLRGAYGLAGNNRIAPFQYLTQFNTSSQYALAQNLTTAYASADLANPGLKWESTTSRDIGVDGTVFNNRLNFSVDVYRNTTNNLLLAVPVPTTSGYTTQTANVGATENKGLEIQLAGKVMQTRSFTWTANFNISFNKNTVVSLGDELSYLANSGWAGSGNLSDYIVKKGQPVGSMYGFVSEGFYQLSDFSYNPNSRVYTLKPGEPNNGSVTAGTPMPGSIKYRSISGDSVINSNTDQKIIGNANPKFFGGINQTFTWKGFDATVFINFQYGNKIFNDNKLEFSSGYTPGATLLGIMKNRWHTVDQNGNAYESLVGGQVVGASPDSLAALNKGAKLWIPVVGSSSTTFSPTSWAVEDGSFIRINNITIGYTLPPALTRRMHLSRLRFYLTANNVAVLTHYTGYDPEVNVRTATPVTPGVDYSAYPRNRSFIGGVNLSF
jgi:TonB-dependent starch-binding outer membrane protein SusC